MHHSRPSFSVVRFACAVLYCTALSACSRANPVDSSPHDLASVHFTLSYYGLDSATAHGLLRQLEANRTRIMTDLAVDSMPSIRILVHTDSAFRARWSGVIARSGIAFQVKALANGTDEIHVYGPWATQHSSELPSAVLHEFTHCVTLQLALQHGDSSHAPGATAPSAGDVRHAYDRWLSEAHCTVRGGSVNRRESRRCIARRRLSHTGTIE